MVHDPVIQAIKKKKEELAIHLMIIGFKHNSKYTLTKTTPCGDCRFCTPDSLWDDGSCDNYTSEEFEVDAVHFAKMKNLQKVLEHLEKLQLPA